MEVGRPVDRAPSVSSSLKGSGWLARLERVGVLSLISILTLNFWTGSPLFALWLGSRVQGSGRLTMLVVAVILVTIGVLSLVLIRALNSLTQAYDRLTGRPSRRREASWLRSRDVERLDLQKERGAPEARPSAVDIILVVSVVVPFVAFEIWFFFYASDPIPKWAF
jgi:hypothetical protein